MATISLSKLKGLASQQLNDMDQAYSAIGYQRVGNSYVPDPNYISAAQAPSIQNQINTATGQTPITAQTSADTGVPVGTDPASLNGKVVTKPVVPDTGTINNDIAGGNTVLSQIKQLQNLVNTANSGGDAPSMGRAQAVTGFIRKIVGANNIATSKGDIDLKNLGTTLSQALDQFFLNQKLNPSTIAEAKNLVPVATDDQNEAQDKLQKLTNLITTQQQNVEAQYPNYFPSAKSAPVPNYAPTPQAGPAPTASPSPAAAAPAAKPGLSSIFGF